MDSISKESVFSNLIWRFAERSGAQIVQFVVSIVLARILMPDDYGTVALILVFAKVFQVFVDSGLGNALIQKKDADDLDFSSVFYFNVVWCLVLYVVVFLTAPYISVFYNNSEMTGLIRVLCLTIVVSGLKNVQQAYVSRHMLFRKFFYATLSGTICSAFVGIAIAKIGGGAWALVAQKLTNLVIDTLVLWIFVRWRPKKMFSLERLKVLISYGWKLLVAALLDTIYNNMRSLIIGKVYTQAELAYYNQGKQFPEIIVTNINSSIDSVLLPVLSKKQDDKTKVRDMTRRSIKTSVYIMAPIMIGLVSASDSLIKFLLTEKWIFCVPFLCVFCISYLFYPIHTANLNAIKAMGRSDLFLKLEIIKKTTGIILLLISLKYGVLAIAISLLINTFISQIVNSWPNRKLLNYGYLDQIKDILPSIMLAIVMGVCIYPIKYLNIPLILILSFQVLTGSILYFIGSKLLRIDSFEYLFNIVRPYILGGKKNG